MIINPDDPLLELLSRDTGGSSRHIRLRTHGDDVISCFLLLQPVSTHPVPTPPRLH